MSMLMATEGMNASVNETGSRSVSKTPLSKKQKKARAASKRAKKARRKNR